MRVVIREMKPHIDEENIETKVAIVKTARRSR